MVSLMSWRSSSSMHSIAKPDAQICREVLEELRWDPRIAHAQVGVSSNNAVVTLTGVVDSYARKLAAQQAAHRVWGVLDVANDIEVRPSGVARRSDAEIAQAVRHALQWDALVADDLIHSTVSNGWVTLSGAVERCAQRDEAMRAVRNLAGVTGVTNSIMVAHAGNGPPLAEGEQLRASIMHALERQADRRAGSLTIDVRDGVVTLSGRVQSQAERETIRATVACAPGVRSVQDRLVVRSG
jgi:osmotically-inducible protein OsmY